MNLGEIGSRIKKTHIRTSNKHDDITVESSTTFKSFRRVKSAAIRLEDSKWGKDLEKIQILITFKYNISNSLERCRY